MPTVTLSPWPTSFSQINDPAWDGEPGSGDNAANQCGPESVSACLYYLTGVNIPADSILDAEYGQGFTGYTDYNHMQWFFGNKCSTPTGLLLASAGVLAQHIKGWLDQGHPAIVLWWADIPHKAGGHFSPVFSYTTNGSGQLVSLTRHNVYGGRAETFSMADFAQAVSVDSTGTATALSVNRVRCLGQ